MNRLTDPDDGIVRCDYCGEPIDLDEEPATVMGPEDLGSSSQGFSAQEVADSIADALEFMANDGAEEAFADHVREHRGFVVHESCEDESGVGSVIEW